MFLGVFTEEKLQFSHSFIKHRLLEVCSDGCSSITPIPAQGLWSSVRVTIGFLVISLTKAILPRLLSLVGQPTF